METEKAQPRGYRYALGGAVLSGVLLHLAHSSQTTGHWAVIGLVPLLIATTKARSYATVIGLCILASLSTILIIFESVLFAFPTALPMGIALESPQFILPLLAWTILQRQHRPQLAGFAFCGSWLVLEALRMHPLLYGTLTSVYALAYSQDSELGFRALDLLGVHSTSALILAINVGIAFVMLKQNLLLFSGVTIVTLIAIIGVRSPELPQQSALSSTSVKLIQPGFTSEEIASLGILSSATTGYSLQLAALVNDSRDISTLAILPETTLHAGTTLEVIQPNLETNVVTGVVDDISNAAYVLSSTASEVIYKKFQLVPLFETSRFEPGSYASTIELETGLILGVVICLDGINPWLIANAVSSGAEVIAVLNGTHFSRGYSTASSQLHVARIQARLNNIPILFVSSNGPTALISNSGEILEILSEGLQGSLQVVLD